MLLHLPFALRNIAHAIWPHKTTGMDVIQCKVMNLLKLQQKGDVVRIELHIKLHWTLGEHNT